MPKDIITKFKCNNKPLSYMTNIILVLLHQLVNFTLTQSVVFQRNMSVAPDWGRLTLLDVIYYHV